MDKWPQHPECIEQAAEVVFARMRASNLRRRVYLTIAVLDFLGFILVDFPAAGWLGLGCIGFLIAAWYEAQWGMKP